MLSRRQLLKKYSDIVLKTRDLKVIIQWDRNENLILVKSLELKPNLVGLLKCD